MKRAIILVVTIAVVGLLGWYASTLMQSKGKSDTELIEFNIEDTSTVDRIKIKDAFMREIDLVRGENGWTDAEGGYVTQENIKFILEAFKAIEFKGYIPDNSHKTFVNLMSAQHTKVEIFQNGEWVKSWYIGPPSADHYGQIMLLETAAEGKSSLPVMMKIKGLQGIIEPRFFADKRKWACTNIFAVPISKISKVEVTFVKDPVRSFTVLKKGSHIDVYQQNRKLPAIDTSMAYRYLQEYKKVHFNLANFELNEKQIDGLKKSTPFATLTLTETDGKKTKLRMFRIKSDEVSKNEFGDVVNSDTNDFWCELNNGEVVKCQYFVFNRLLLGHLYFPMNLAGRKIE